MNQLTIELPQQGPLRQDMHEIQCQIDLNHSFIYFLSERGVKPGCVKFVTLQTFAGVKSKNAEGHWKNWWEISAHFWWILCYGHGPHCTGGCLPKALQALFKHQGGLMSTKDRSQ